MGDFIVIDGDKAIFTPNFTPAVVVVQPGSFKGSGPATLKGKKVCVAGDEENVSVPGCMYTTPTHSIPGTGKLKIQQLAANQKATKTKTGGQPVLLKGGNFTAVFEVDSGSPAMQPPPGPGSPVRDTTATYSGMGTIQTMNTKFQGT